MSDLAALERRARRAEAERRWADAAGAWAVLADALGRAGDAERAGLAWEAAGEAWRRDDRPRLADKALATAQGLHGDPSRVARARVKRAACASAMGRLADARRHLDAAAGVRGVEALTADGQLDVALAASEPQAAREALERLVAAPGAGVAAAYRSAQIARLDGDLDRASALLDEVEAGLPDDAGRAAVLGERAELAEWCDRWEDALALRAAAVASHVAERRAGPLASAVAAHVRTARLAGVVPSRIDAGAGVQTPPAALARLRRDCLGRDLRVAALDVDLAWALLDDDRARLDATLRTAGALGFRERVGRARVAAVVVGILPETALDAARPCLPWPGWRGRVDRIAQQGRRGLGMGPSDPTRGG